MDQKTSRSFVGLSKTSPRFLERALRRWPQRKSSAVWRPSHSVKPRRSVFEKRNDNGLRKRPNGKPTRRKKGLVHSIEQNVRDRRLPYGPIAGILLAVLIVFSGIYCWSVRQVEKENWYRTVEPQPPPKEIAAPTPEKKPEAKKEIISKVFRDRLKNGQEGPEMVVVPAGSFKMGDVQGGGLSDELPARTVNIQKPFAIGRYEVTFEEYDQFAKATNRQLPGDKGWGRGRRPVINVSWQDAVAYAKWLSEQNGKRYRLPTEAEWEYAARGGKETAYWWGKDFVKGMANCNGCGSQWERKQTAPVGSFKPNPFGLYDTAGNVWEWVEDCWHDNYNGAPVDGSAWKEKGGGNCGQRVLRGGSWNLGPVTLRVSSRSGDYAGNRDLGFRLAQDLD